MKLETFALDVSATLNGLGVARDVQNYYPSSIQFGDKSGGGAFDGTYQIEASIDGTTYSNVGAAVTANGFVHLNGFVFTKVRIKTTVAPTNASTKPTVTLAGLNQHTS